MDPKTRLDGDAAGEKRNIPPVLQKLLAYDVEMTKRFVSFSLNFVPIRSLKTHCKFLEVRKLYFVYFDGCYNISNSTPATVWSGWPAGWRSSGCGTAPACTRCR